MRSDTAGASPGYVGGGFWQRIELLPGETILAQVTARRDRGINTYGRLFLTNQRVIFAKNWISPVFMLDRSWEAELSAITRLTFVDAPGLYAWIMVPSFRHRCWIKFGYDGSENGFIFSSRGFERALRQLASEKGWLAGKQLGHD